ncbi:hypothetical protein CQ10_24145 [Bradyrhizobium valentinum]|nr:hypothetical protein CQ10_24145 [Bradyrhizobium valentinum]
MCELGAEGENHVLGDAPVEILAPSCRVPHIAVFSRTRLNTTTRRQDGGELMQYKQGLIGQPRGAASGRAVPQLTGHFWQLFLTSSIGLESLYEISSYGADILLASSR